MATVAELRILFTAIYAANRAVNAIERDINRAAATADRASRQQAAANALIGRSEKNLETVTAQVHKNIEAVRKRGVRETEAASKAERRALEEVTKAKRARDQVSNQISTTKTAISDAAEQARIAGVEKLNDARKKLRDTELSAQKAESDAALTAARRRQAALEAEATALTRRDKLLANRKVVIADLAKVEATADRESLKGKADLLRMQTRLDNIDRDINDARKTYNNRSVDTSKIINRDDENLKNLRIKNARDVLDAKQALTNTEIAIDKKRISTAAQGQTQIEGLQKKELTLSKQLGDSRRNYATVSAQADNVTKQSHMELVRSIQTGKGQIESAHNAAGKAAQTMGTTTRASFMQAALASGAVRTAATVTGVAIVGLGAVIGKLGYDFNAFKETATVAFTGVLKSAPLATKFMEEIYAWTRKTALGFEISVNAAREFVARGMDLKDVIPNLEIIANAAASMPRPFEDSVQRISYAIGQIGQSAKLNSQDIRQLTEVGVGAWQYLTEATGASIDQIQDDALKFGLTGKRAAQIILEGMKGQFGGMLELQAQTARGQLTIARRNIQEIAGVFTQPIFEEFKKSLIGLNKLIGSDEFRTSVKGWSDAIVEAANNGKSAVQLLIDAIEAMPTTKLIEFVVKQTGVSGSDIATAGLGGAIRGLPVIGPLIAANQAYNATKTNAPNLEDLNEELAILQNRASRLANTGREDTEMFRNLERDMQALQGEISGLKSDMDSAGGSANQLGDILVVTLNKAMQAAQQEVTKKTTEITENQKALDDLFKGPTREMMRADIDITQLKQAQRPDRAAAEVNLRNLDRAAQAAADAIDAQTDAIDSQIRVIDEQIDSYQREIAARDRAEQRAEMVADMQVSAAQKAVDAFDVMQRQFESASLAKSVKRLGQDLESLLKEGKPGLKDFMPDMPDPPKPKKMTKREEEAWDAAQWAKKMREYNEDVVKAKKDHAKAEFDYVREIEDAREAYAQAQRDVVKANLDAALNAENAAKEQKKQQDALTRFDRETNEQLYVQGLQDQQRALQTSREEIERSGVAQQKAYDVARQGIEDHVAKLDEDLKKLEDHKIALDEANTILKLQADIANPLVKSQEALNTETQGIVEKFIKLNVELEKATQTLASINKQQADRAKQDLEHLTSPEQRAAGARAFGGPVQAQQAYWVGENGKRELFVPDSNGHVYPIGATTNNNKRMLNLAPITINVAGGAQGMPRDYLDMLYQGY